MVIGPTKGTDFMQALVSNINVQIDSSKPAFLSKQSIMVNSNNSPNRFKQGNQNWLFPELLRQPRNADPLVNMLNGGRVEVEKGNIRSQDRVKTFHKPQPINPSIVTIRHSGKFENPFPSSIYSTRPLTCFQFSLVLGMMSGKEMASPQILARRHKVINSFIGLEVGGRAYNGSVTLVGATGEACGSSRGNGGGR